ncbi:WXG100 family type VII secretion target [Mycobacterium sp. NPDC003449]
MATSLTPQEAETKIGQVDEAMTTARTLANNILERAETMTASSWLGGKAQKFAGMMTQHHDDFTAVITQLTQVAETGKSNMRTLANMDSD